MPARRFHGLPRLGELHLLDALVGDEEGDLLVGQLSSHGARLPGPRRRLTVQEAQLSSRRRTLSGGRPTTARPTSVTRIGRSLSTGLWAIPSATRPATGGGHF